ncbi:hypothetical protein LOTGIDRAFT_207842 [Lottia gigantea]|uniref:Lysosomal Pro-X carboxypeptidase n=1 Tax=Lottia gigantea TaxID=225164 RepID=V4A580_LOTGI|nr:hypothetical protein LOTGIDRAFT_207842 [Lottia gigantea]ESO99078.1 hypothetical protein LOTGIDRAFT_207842 [Lottia gigantea]
MWRGACFQERMVDHFGFVNQDTYKQRYLVADQFWNKNDGPIFFYTGNEGDITLFCNNTGFVWDIAPEFHAMIVFAEHRYYGTSLPYGDQSYKDPSKLNYLTSEQALADFATLIEYIKSTTPGSKNSKVVTFGGSYGGMLSAWFRIKYPNIVVGALAASAPILQFHNLTPCSAYDKVVTKTFASYSQNCVDNIRQVYSTIDDLAKSGGNATLSFLTSTFQLCKPLKSSDIDTLEGWLEGIWGYLAMINYPYPANFLEPLPAWPVKGACKPLLNILNGKELIEGVAKSIKFYFNSTGNTQCLNITQQATGNLGTGGWDYQSCTEMVMPMCSDNTTIFRPVEWNYTAISDNCYKQFKVRPRHDWINTNYWGKSLSSASNIIFSNGQYDPWISGGVTQSQSDTVVAIYIKYGAHHLDLRSANPLDTDSVKAARQQEKNIIRQWLYTN